MNPVWAGIVKKASEYLYSSASHRLAQGSTNYIGEGGLLDLVLPSAPIIDPLEKGYHLDIDEW